MQIVQTQCITLHISMTKENKTKKNNKKAPNLFDFSVIKFIRLRGFPKKKANTTNDIVI